MRSKVVVLVAMMAATIPVTQAPAQDRAGVASAVTQTARGQVGGSGMRTIRIGKAVFRGERITTNARGRVQVLLADGSNFVVGPNSSLVIDEFVYQPEQGAGRIVATFGRGSRATWAERSPRTGAGLPSAPGRERSACAVAWPTCSRAATTPFSPSSSARI